MKFFFAFVLLLSTAHAGINLNRTVSGKGVKGSLTVKTSVQAKPCATHDEWGDNTCDIAWNQSISLDLEATFDKQITSGTLEVDLKFEKVIPLKFSCPLCGANCTFTVPIIKIPVTIALPDCPLENPLSLKIDADLPDKSPLGPVKVPITGSIVASDSTKTESVKIHIDVLLD